LTSLVSVLDPHSRMSAGGNLGKLWRIWSNPKNEFPIKIKKSSVFDI
jgi:hypothetical protein